MEEASGIHSHIGGSNKNGRGRKKPAGQMYNLFFHLLWSAECYSTSVAHMRDLNDTPVFNQYTIQKELKHNQECLAIIIHPVMRQLVADSCKNDITYFVFVPRRVVEALIDYLRERKMRWGKIEDIEPLFILERITKRKKEPIQLIMSESAILDAIKDAARLAGLSDWRAVTAISLRKVFNNFLINQENRALKEEEREFFMGHLIFQVQEIRISTKPRLKKCVANIPD